ncbi:hypothetical protein L1887_08351 [Cichorium endivia]|nr:hypothetical protein L1887_08351 [Cichorium endivia]
MNNAGGVIPVVLADPRKLCCPICFHPLCSPIYQCGHGHSACSSCCVKEKRKCPSCFLPIGFIRCEAMEKLIESLIRSWTHLILQERNEGVIFILNHAIQGHVRVFSVDCIGPSTFDNAFVYQLTAKYKKTVLSLEATPEVWSKWRQHAPDDNCLIIPSGFSEFFIQVRIKKVGPVV